MAPTGHGRRQHPSGDRRPPDASEKWKLPNTPGLGILKVLPLAFPNVSIRLVLVWLANQLRTKAHQLIQEQFRQTRDALITSAPLPYDAGM